MTNQYVLRRLDIGSPNKLSITQSDALLLSAAKKLVVEASLFEERFEQLVTALIEFENELNRMAVDQMLNAKFGYEYFRRWRLEINRRVRNILSDGKFYEDAGKRQMRGLDRQKLQSGAFNAFTDEFAAQEKKSDEYVICSALRNFSQHQGLAVGQMRIGSAWTGRRGQEALLHHLEAYVDVNEMLADPRLEGSRRKALNVAVKPRAGVLRTIDIRRLIRQYVSCLATVHTNMRAFLRPSIDKAEANIHAAMSDYKKAFPNEDSLIGLALVEVDQNGLRKASEDLFEALIGYRQDLSKRHGGLKNLARFHITSQKPPKRRRRKRAA